MFPIPPDPKVQLALRGFREDINRMIARRLVIEPLFMAPGNVGFLCGVLLDTAAFLTAAGERATGILEPGNMTEHIAHIWQTRWYFWRGAIASMPTDPSTSTKFIIDYLEQLLKEPGG